MSPFPGILPDEPIDSVAHLIQIALTPVFMLSGIGTLLNLLNTRLTRVSDHIESTNDKLDNSDDIDLRVRLRQHLTHLHRRLLFLDTAIMFGAVGGAASCGAAFVLFLGSVRDSSVANWLLLMFGVALGCTVGALGMFLGDCLLAWHGIRRARTPRSENMRLD